MTRLCLATAAQRWPERLALVAGDRCWTFRDLAGLVGGASPAIRAAAPGAAEDASAPIAVLASNTVATVVTVHACLALGRPLLPIHPRLTERERARLLTEAGVADLVVPERLLPSLDGDASLPPAPPDDERPAAVLFTSGTTGTPKGVVLPRRALVASAAASEAVLGWADGDRWLLCLPLAHVGGLSILTRCLTGGRTVVLADPSLTRAPRELLRVVHEARVTLLSVVPTLLERLLGAGLDGASPLRAILLGGAAAPPFLLARARSARLPVLPTYGLTEASSQATTVRPGTLPDPANGSGPPLPGVDLRIGPTGTIQLRGRTLLSGHHPAGRHPAPLADGWLDTGDHGRIDGDGNLHVLGRRTDLIVSGGENVYPAEVEAALIAQPGVVAACVIGEDDDAWGQRVLAVIVAAPPFESGEALIQAVSASLAPFKRPRRVVLVDELPLNQTGKIDRAEVRRRVLPSD